jgi:hypothetical protein
MKVSLKINGFLWHLIRVVALTKDNLKNVTSKVVIIVVFLVTRKLSKIYVLISLCKIHLDEGANCIWS